MIDEILEKYPNDVKVVIKNFPLSFHKEAERAAEYALAAHEQGKYKELAKAIFDDYENLKNNEDLPIELAKNLGLDIKKLISDADSDKIKDQIKLEISQLKKSGIERLAVPKFFIQGKEVNGEYDLTTFSAIIDAELELINK